MLDDALTGERLIGVIQPTVERRDGRPGAGALSARLRRPHRPICRDRRRALFSDADGRRAVPPGRRSAEPSAPIGSRSPTIRRSPRIFSRARAKRRSIARTCSRRCKRFAEVNEIKVVWSDIKKASNEALVNGLSMMSPCGPKEKQALLEAPDLKSRAEMLVAITTIELARGEDAATQISLARAGRPALAGGPRSRPRARRYRAAGVSPPRRCARHRAPMMPVISMLAPPRNGDDDDGRAPAARRDRRRQRPHAR